MKAQAFELISSSKQTVANFSEEITAFVQEKNFDGIEIDWQWPGQKGGSKDRDQLTLLVKVSCMKQICIIIDGLYVFKYSMSRKMWKAIYSFW